MMELGQANLEVFSATLLELARQNSNLLVVTSDSRGSAKLAAFGKAAPGQIVEVGIAEQNLVGVAAGLASVGKKVFAVSPACFLTARSLEQIKNDVCYSDQPVKLVGISAGVSYGALGSTHHSLHDFAVLRAIHNITIVVPADNYETRNVILAAAESTNPFYLRFGKKRMPDLPRPEEPFQIGKASTVRAGNDITFMATGETVAPAYEAAELLAADGIQSRVLSFHTIKPLDQAAILKAAAETGAIVTVEEHSVHGGLGEGCAGMLMEHDIPVPFKIVGFPDEYTMTGNQEELFGYYGISGKALRETGLALLKKKKDLYAVS